MYNVMKVNGTEILIVVDNAPTQFQPGDTIELIQAFQHAADATRYRLTLSGQPARRKRVQCIETGQVYESATAAAYACGGTTSAMSNHLRGRPDHKSVRGLTWRYV